VNNVNIPKQRAYHHGNLRAALIKATLRAIAEDGPEGFTLRDVARRAGVSPSAPYRHFQDKDELLAAVAGECAERIGAMMDEAVSAEPGDALAKFRASGIAYVRFVVAHPEHFRALNVPNIVAKMPAEQRGQWDSWNTVQRDALAGAQAAGVISDLPLDELCLAAGALVHGLGHMIVEGKLGEVDAARAEQLAIAVTGVLGEGLIPRAPAAKTPLDPRRARRRQ
jgi:AcrR family transcriptional regulator